MAYMERCVSLYRSPAVPSQISAEPGVSWVAASHVWHASQLHGPDEWGSENSAFCPTSMLHTSACRESLVFTQLREDAAPFGRPQRRAGSRPRQICCRPIPLPRQSVPRYVQTGRSMQAAAAEAERDDALQRLQAAEQRAERLQVLHREASEKLESVREQRFGGAAEVPPPPDSIEIACAAFLGRILAVLCVLPWCRASACALVLHSHPTYTGVLSKQRGVLCAAPGRPAANVPVAVVLPCAWKPTGRCHPPA